jgi:endoglucanase
VIEPENPFKPTEGGANGSKFAARMKGTIGDTIQYPFAGMGFLFVDTKGAYDVSSCEGIKFFAKKGDEGETVNMRLKVGDVNTVPEGGVCKECYNDFGRDILLTNEWSEITAPFFEMKQEPYWGESQPGLVKTHVYQVQFQVVARGTFDVWVDDVSLTGCKAQPE